MNRLKAVKTWITFIWQQTFIEKTSQFKLPFGSIKTYTIYSISKYLFRAFGRHFFIRHICFFKMSTFGVDSS